MQSYIATYCVQLVFLYLPPPFQCLRAVCIDKRSVSAWVCVCVFVYLCDCFWRYVLLSSRGALTHTRMRHICVCVCVLFWRVGMPWQVPYRLSKLFIASFSFSRLSVVFYSTFQLYSQFSNFHSTRHGGFANSILFWVMQNEFKTLKNSSFITLESKPLI